MILCSFHLQFLSSRRCRNQWSSKMRRLGRPHHRPQPRVVGQVRELHLHLLHEAPKLLLLCPSLEDSISRYVGKLGLVYTTCSLFIPRPLILNRLSFLSFPSFLYVPANGFPSGTIWLLEAPYARFNSVWRQGSSSFAWRACREPYKQCISVPFCSECLAQVVEASSPPWLVAHNSRECNK